MTLENEILKEIVKQDIFLPENEKIKKELIAKLKNILPEEIQSRLESISSKYILFIGNKDQNLAAVCYTHCLKGHGNLSLYKLYDKNIGTYLLEPIWSEICYGEVIKYKASRGQEGEIYRHKIADWYRNGYSFLVRRPLKETCFFSDASIIKNNDTIRFLNSIGKLKEFKEFDGKDYCEQTDVLFIISTNNKADDIPELFRYEFEPVDLSKVINLEPEKPGVSVETPKDTLEESSYLLDNANYLHVGKTPIKLQPAHADLLRFMVKELKGNSLDLQYILTYHYGIETMNKIRLSKEERQSFDRETNKVNSLCKKALKKNLIKSLGDKKFTLSVNIKLPKNSPKDSL